MRSEELKKMEITNDNIVKLLEDYSDRDSIILLLCAVIGICMYSGMSRGEVFDLFTALCDEVADAETEANLN